MGSVPALWSDLERRKSRFLGAAITDLHRILPIAEVKPHSQCSQDCVFTGSCAFHWELRLWHHKSWGQLLVPTPQPGISFRCKSRLYSLRKASLPAWRLGLNKTLSFLAVIPSPTPRLPHPLRLQIHWNSSAPPRSTQPLPPRCSVLFAASQCANTRNNSRSLLGWLFPPKSPVRALRNCHSSVWSSWEGQTLRKG